MSRDFERFTCGNLDNSIWTLEKQSSILHHDNAPSHTALLIQQFLAKQNTVVISEPPYSPDMLTCDFFLFLEFKESVKQTTTKGIPSVFLKSETALAYVYNRGCGAANGQKLRVGKLIKSHFQRKMLFQNFQLFILFQVWKLFRLTHSKCNPSHPQCLWLVPAVLSPDFGGGSRHPPTPIWSSSL